MAKAREKIPSFEESLKDLENIVTKLELGNLALDEALNEFENGVKLAKQAQIQLQNAEQRIQILLTETSDAELADFTDSDN